MRFPFFPFLPLLWAVNPLAALAQTPAGPVYALDASAPTPPVRTGQLKLGGTNAQGHRLDVNNTYISQDGRPIIPVTGEFHFSRYPEAYWEESIKKMKAGGISMIATYVFWNIHEEVEGKFNWTGNRNLRKFVELCAKNDMPVVIRIGPFCHGEIRNGGFPDWLLGRPFTVRSNDPGYLAYVEKLYQQIGQQLTGLYFKDGGPLVATQIENEYQHSASPWTPSYPGQPMDWTTAERDLALTQSGVGVSAKENPYADLGNDHMRVLKALAQQAGINTPLYTATGWGNAAIIPHESLPVTSAYAYPSWTATPQPSPMYLYADMHKTPDYAPVRYQPEDYPAFAAELGAGIMTTYTRRPVVPAKSLDALINRCLGGGSNGIGYYMYHGGTTPVGEHVLFSDEAYAYPKLSYDFQAPIGEYGQLRPSFHRLKLLHFFTAAFGDVLAPMTTVLPANQATLKPTDAQALRYAVRVQGNAGFLFVNNFQDHAAMRDKNDLRVRIKTASGEVLIPEQGGFALKNEESAIFPFNFDVNGATLTYATAQLLTKAPAGAAPYYVFYAAEGGAPEFSFAKGNGVSIKAGPGTSVAQNDRRWLVKCPAGSPAAQFTVTTASGTTTVLVLSKQQALKAWLVPLGGQPRLVFSEALVLPDGPKLELFSAGQSTFNLEVFPRLATKPTLDHGRVSLTKGNPLFSTYTVTLPEVKLTAQTQRIGEKKLVVTLPEKPAGVQDVFLNLSYVGDTGMGFINGQLVADEFYKGQPWQLGLRQFWGQPGASEMLFYFRPLYQGAPFLVDLDPATLPDLTKTKSVVRVQGATLTPEYKVTASF